MTFPQVEATNTSTASGTSHAVSLPAGIEVGNLLLVFFATDGDISFSDLDGFTELFSMDNGTATSLSVLYKIAEGSDTLTLVTNESEGSAHVSVRITGYDTGQMPEVSTGVVGVKTKPGTPAPTNLYDIKLLALDGIDIMGGALANRSSANTEFAAPLVGSDPWMIPVPGPVQLNIVNNIVNGAEGVVKIYYVAE